MSGWAQDFKRDGTQRPRYRRFWRSKRLDKVIEVVYLGEYGQRCGPPLEVIVRDFNPYPPKEKHAK